MSDDIYVILHNQEGFNGPLSYMSSMFTTDALQASKALVCESRVFKLNNLEELKEIEVTYQEIPKSLAPKEVE
jgi:hypothetical protein